jgi:hypothetical protein
MQVKHALPRVPAGVDDKAEPGIGDSFFSREPSRHLKDFADQRVIFGFDIEHAGQMLARYEQNMDGCLWSNVGKGNDAIVLMDDISFDLPSDKGAKKATVHRISPAHPMRATCQSSAVAPGRRA